MALFDEDGRKIEKGWPLNLEAMSVTELEEYITALKGEIARVEMDIVSKKAHQDALDGLFKS